MVIDLFELGDVAFTDDERPIHRRVWATLRLGQWRRAWCDAEAQSNFEAMAALNREYEFILGT